MDNKHTAVMPLCHQRPWLLVTLQKIKTNVGNSRHNGGPIAGPLKPLDGNSAVMFEEVSCRVLDAERRQSLGQLHAISVKLFQSGSQHYFRRHFVAPRKFSVFVQEDYLYLFRKITCICSGGLFVSSDRSSDRRPNLCKERRTVAGELYIPQQSCPFSASLLTLFPSIHISF